MIACVLQPIEQRHGTIQFAEFALELQLILLLMMLQSDVVVLVLVLRLSSIRCGQRVIRRLAAGKRVAGTMQNVLDAEVAELLQQLQWPLHGMMLVMKIAATAAAGIH